MENRLLPGRVAYTDEFISGVDEFIRFACSQQKYLSEKVIRCPCKLCKNKKHLIPDEVSVHLFQKGFTPRYWYWTSHREKAPSINLNEHVYSASSSHQGYSFDMPSSSQSNILGDDYEHVNRYQGMIYNAAGVEFRHQVEPNVEESPNMDATRFYKLLNSAQETLWPGCKYSESSVVVKMMSIKYENNMSRVFFNSMAQLMKDTSHPDNKIPRDYYQAKKLVSGLGLTSQKIDCCVNGCMLYYKADKDMTECKFCKEPRYKECVHKKDSKKVPHKTMHYLPLITRLQRLYASMRSAEHMRWHYENRREEGVLCHPSDGEAWKHFDRTYPDFVVEPRNVRLVFVLTALLLIASQHHHTPIGQ
ncbi:uncharacterized protein LOC132047411 [Lycium ferocissimum]|uniref:uncharacterized protein LOC132047411 n=1 Tax=Lycium ferocissimum TaxID=112874 RepID=UPI002815C074|nr:uncharacterized protein LOC132047411 [Lycium ferocissimum]